MAGGRKDCLPFVKKEGMVELDDKNQLRELYKEPVICMLRIKESVDGWGKRLGADGYFTFTEDFMGNSVPRDQIH